MGGQLHEREEHLKNVRGNLATLETSINGLQEILLNASEELEKLEGRKEVLKERKKNAAQNKSQLQKAIVEGEAQPALLTTSYAFVRALEEEGIKPDFTAGHSLGEYTALVASGAISFEDAVYTVRKRGEFMEAAVPNGQGSMAAILGMDREALTEVTAGIENAGAS